MLIKEKKPFYLMFKKRKDKSSYFAECAFMKSEYRYYLNIAYL